MKKVERIAETIFRQTIKALVESDYFEKFLDVATVDEYFECTDEQKDLIWDKVNEKRENFLKK